MERKSEERLEAEPKPVVLCRTQRKVKGKKKKKGKRVIYAETRAGETGMKSRGCSKAFRAVFVCLFSSEGKGLINDSRFPPDRTKCFYEKCNGKAGRSKEKENEALARRIVSLIVIGDPSVMFRRFCRQF